MIVRDIMTPDPVVAEATSTVGEVLRVLQSSGVRHVPIVDKGELVGIVSDRDLRGLALPVGDFESLGRLNERLQEPIARHMSADVVTVAPDSEIREAIDVMLDQQVGAVPVLERLTGDVVGIVSYVDVLRALREVWQ